MTYTIASPPTISITTPANGATYPLKQSIASSFSCADGANGSGISSCTDQNGHASGAPIDTSSTGQKTLTVTATSSDGETSTASGTYNVAAPPAIWLPLPQNGAVYTQGQSVNSYFLCTDGQGGPGLTSCVDQSGHQSGGTVDTSTLGAHTYTVTATSADGQTATAKANYTVVPPPTVSNAKASHGLITFSITLPAGGAVDAMATTSFGSFALARDARAARARRAAAVTYVLQPPLGTIVYGRADTTAGPGTATVTLNMTPAAKVLLRDHRRATTQLVVSYTGSAGLPQTIATLALPVTR